MDPKINFFHVQSNVFLVQSTFFLSNQKFSDLIGQENVSNDVRSEGGETDRTHFLVRLNLKTFDRTRKTLIGREKPLIKQGKVDRMMEFGPSRDGKMSDQRGKNTTKGIIGHFRTRRACVIMEFSP